jgi:hypothetical protein
VSRAAALTLCLVALWLRLDHLGDLPLWVDEAFTWENAGRSTADLVGARVDVHPPLYFLLIRYAIRLIGQSEYALRFPGALLSVLAVPALWYVGRRLGGGWVGLVAAAAMAVAPTALSYAREARMYGLLMAEAALVLAAAEWVARRPSARRWLVYGLAAFAAGMTHYTALAAIAAGALWTLGRRRALPSWLAVHAVLTLLFAAWGVHFWANRDIWWVRTWHPWAARFAVDQQVVDWATAMAGRPLGPRGLADLLDPTRRLDQSLVVATGLAALVGLVALAGRRRWLPALALAGLAFGPIGAIVLLEPIRPMWHVRLTLVALPGVLALAACAAGLVGEKVAAAGRGKFVPIGGSVYVQSDLGARALRAGAALALGALVIGPQLYGWARGPAEVREDWRAVARQVRERAQPGEVALGGLESMAGYYLTPILPVRQRPIALGRPPEVVVDELNARVGPARAVWLVPAGDPLLDRDDLVGTVLARYATGRQDWEVGGLRVARIELRPRERIALPSARPIAATYGGALQLTGYSAERAPPGADPVVHLSLDGRLDRPLGRDYKLFAHLLDRDGKTVAQHDVVVVDPSWRPTSQMPPGTRLRIEVEVVGPADRVRAGQAIGIGFYDERSGERLPLEPAAPEHRLVLPVSDGA